MFSVVIPVYYNEASLPQLISELKDVDEQLKQALEVVFVIDGCKDNSASLLRRELSTVGFSSKVLVLSRNFGSFAAIRAGFTETSGDLIAVLAADLQEPTTLLLDFESALLDSESDIAVGVRKSRKDPYLSKLFSNTFWQLYRKIAQPEMPRGGIDIFACTRQVLDEILKLPESNSSLVGLVVWLGFNRVEVPYERKERQHGKSGWTLKKKLRYLFDSVYSFSDLPFRILLWLGIAGLIVSLLISFVVFFSWFFDLITVPGYTVIVLLITCFSALNCIGFGFVGGYLWRTFENTKARPGFIIARQWSRPERKGYVNEQ